MRIRAKKDVYAGLMFIAFGLLFGIGALNYPMGSALRMGPQSARDRWSSPMGRG